MATVRCVIVTPERTEADLEASNVVLPMIDGELGVLPGRAPMVGRLGYGNVRIESGEGNREVFVEGGFVKVEDNVASVLTSAAQPATQLDASAAQTELDDAIAMPGATPEQQALKDQAVHRARGKVAAAKG